MTTERTLSILKPDALVRNITGKINTEIENEGLIIIAQKMIHLTKKQAESFYAVHNARPFFGELVEQMSALPVLVQILQGENAVAKYREIIGATNPKEATPNTIRAKYALSVAENSVHGSDSLENAAKEISFFFSGIEIVK